MRDKPWISDIPSNKQERNEPVTKCTYWPVLGSFNNWNIIQLSQKSTPYDAFDEKHQVILGGISDNRPLWLNQENMVPLTHRKRQRMDFVLSY